MAKPIVAPDLARRIRRLMDKAAPPITVADLVKVTGMRQQGINDILQGHVRRPGKLLEIARRLNTTQEYLLDGKGPADLPVRKQPSASIIQVPQINWVQAGKANEQPFEPQDVPLLAFADLGRGDFFALKVDGDSMDRVSPDGSIIVVNRADTLLVTGRFYVFSIRGSTTYKAWQGGEHKFLKPYSTNPSHDPIPFNKRVVVIGRVCRTVLDL